MTAMSSEHGKSKSSLCKVTVNVQIGSLYHPSLLPSVVRPAGSFIPLSFHYAESFLRAPDGLWRPPQSSNSVHLVRRSFAVDVVLVQDLSPYVRSHGHRVLDHRGSHAFPTFHVDHPTWAAALPRFGSGRYVFQ